MTPNGTEGREMDKACDEETIPDPESPLTSFELRELAAMWMSLAVTDLPAAVADQSRNTEWLDEDCDHEGVLLQAIRDLSRALMFVRRRVNR